MSEQAPDLVLRCVVGVEIIVFKLPAHGTVTIGRAPECELQLNESGVSRQHVRVHIGDRVWVEDLGSANGTFVSGAALADEDEEEEGTVQTVRRRLEPGQKHEMRPGDVVYVATALCALERAKARTPARDGPVVLDPTMENVFAMAERIADAPISVLLLGETGVGKEVLAETIVRRSRRATRPFLRINCAAFQPSLLESELFGHVRGSFTGAVKNKPGLFETANGGTVFLDEVGDIPIPIQVKLLRVLEARQVHRVGALAPQPIDVRFISATNRNLEDDVRRGTFREDLYFRLNGVSLYVPPLRERRAEIAPLANQFIALACQGMGQSDVPTLGEDALEALMRCPWRGNIRELRNTMERAVALCGPGPIGLSHLPRDVAYPTHSAPLAPRPPVVNYADEEAATLRGQSFATRATLPPTAADASERDRILAALDECGGNQTRAAKLLGISRTTLVARLDQYGTKRPRK